MSAVSRRAFLLAASAVAVVAGLPAGASAPAAPVPAIPRRLPTLADLKAWSERALAVLQKHWPENIYGEVFLSEGDSPHGLRIWCDCPGRSKEWCLRCSSVLPGTPMIGAMSGYYEPEWDERTTAGILQDVVWWSERPVGISDSEWVEALAVVGMTPEAHVERMADLARQIGEDGAVWDRMAAEWNREHEEAAHG
ncbi:hypothetical protein ABIE45_005663 [Methylobacterium sp. OAE515]|uniref:hypothetical protein n=1 Tax=Methylobacterium sp. OAE515 TaxID=2817895 RepID=UPI00178BA959